MRRWRSWCRWITLAVLAHAFLVVAALTERTRYPASSELIGLTCNEVQHLSTAQLAQPLVTRPPVALVGVATPPSGRARSCHYRRSEGCLV